MAVPLTLSSVPAQTPYVQYVSSAGQTVFPYPFEITQDSDLVCLINGVGLPTDGGYTLTGQGTSGGGNLVFASGQTVGTIITLYRNVPIARITQLAQNGTFFAANFNNEFNRIYLIMQQLQQSLLPGGNQAYALMIPNSNNPAPTTLLTPSAYAGQYLSFDSNGNPQPAALTSSGTITLSILSPFLGLGQQPAEIAASAVPTNGFVPPYTNTGGIFYPERYGTNSVPGTTNMAVAIQTAISVATAAGGGVIEFGPYNYFLGTTAITVPSNVTLRMVKGGQFTVNSSTPASMPQAYINITGSNVELDGLKGVIASNPFSVYAAQGAFIGFGASNLSNIKIHDCDSTWFMHGIFSSWFATTVANNLTNVLIEKNRFTSYATNIFLLGLAPTNVTVRNNTFETVSHTLSNNGGDIQIMPGVNLANVDAFTEANYDNNYGQKIVIEGNSHSLSLDRPLRVVNCKQVDCFDNQFSLAIGSFFTSSALYSQDVITFDLCRKVSCHDNQIYGGGENGIDVLSCASVDVHDNIINQVNTAAVSVFLSDLWNASVTSPKLNSITNRTNLQTSKVNVHDNDIEAFFCVYVGAGQGAQIHNNNFKLFKTSTNWIGTNTPEGIALDNSAGAPYFTESTLNWMNDIEFKGNRPILVGPVSVTCDSGTGVFTTVGGVPHGFVTGDRVEPVASGTSTTVDFPGNLVYTTDYFIINLTPTTFSLASSRANAFVPTVFALSSNGLTVSGSALLFREQVQPPSIDINPSYYSPAVNIVLDENFPLPFINTFSTLSSIVPGTAFLFKKYKHQYVYDPAVDYGIAVNTLDKYYDIPPVRASDGTTDFGLVVIAQASGGYTFAVGTKPVNIVSSPTDGQIKTSLW